MGKKICDLTGKTFGNLTVIKRHFWDRKGTCWVCQCSCGRITYVRTRSLNYGTKSCGRCLNRKYTGLEGKKYEKLLVLEEVKESTKSGVVYKCRCECGNIVELQATRLVHGDNKSCGKCNRFQGNKLGEVYGDLTVTKQINGNFWECTCKCRNIKILSTSALNRYKKIKAFMPSIELGEYNYRDRIDLSCGCLTKDKKKNYSINTIYSRYKSKSLKRGLDFFLSKEEFIDLTSKNCYFCNEPPHQTYKNVTYTGIDRLDSTKGYNIKNCVPCCWSCNRAKADLSVEDFIKLCVKIVSFNKIKNKSKK